MDVLQTSDFISILKVGTFVDPEEYGLIEVPIEDLGESYDVILLKRNHYEMNSREQAFVKKIKSLLEEL